MPQIIVDAAIKRKLLDLKQPLELCDDQGNVLARLSPVMDSSGWVRVEPAPLTAEELERLEKEPSYSTAEVLAYLEKL